MEDRQSTISNYVIDPKDNIAGKTQTQLADGWWKYANSIPQEDNPALDRTGDFSGANQSGDVYYLSGSFGNAGAKVDLSAEVDRTIVVPEGKILFLPIVGSVTLGNNLGDTTETDLPLMKQQQDNIQVFNLTIDGKPVLNLSQAPDYRQQTIDPYSFDFNTPENSTFAGTPYNNKFLSNSYTDGYYVGIKPLSPGKHTISFQAKTPAAGYYLENIQNITYTIDVKPFNEDINGNGNNNTLIGNGKNDNIDAFGGNDTVYGYGGDDIIDGGSGNDKLYGGNGKDIVYGGAGKDLLDGGNGDDVLAGGLGNDEIEGGNGNDRLYGGSGKDKIEGGNGNDVIFGGDGNDKIEGGNGNDVIDAVAYSALVLPYPDFFDKTKVNSGQEQIDKIEGGNGRDTFVLGMASDAGVTGSAYYVGGGDKDYALIQDFKLGSNGDKIQLYSQTNNPNDYVLGAVANGLPNGVGIYTKDTHDLIGIIQGHNVSLSTLSLTDSSQFNLVSKKPNYVIDPKVQIAGKTQSELANQWWQYDLSTPQDDNPTLDRTGDFAGANQSGDVYFIGGVDGAGNAERTIEVPQGKSIFFPVINTAYVDPTDKTDGVNGFKGIVNQMKTLSEFEVFIDGKQVLGLGEGKKQYQSTDYFNGFDVSLPENHLFTFYTKNNDPINYKSTSQSGYYVGLNPLPPGKHTITFKAKVDNPLLKQDISYTIDVKPFNEDIIGDDNNNTLKGNGENDNIDAFGGDDTVYGYGGDDIIDGWAGNDKLYGGNGNDIVYGGAGNDLLDGGEGNDALAGGLGNDKIYGGEGNDRLYGGSGQDKIYGGEGNDKIFGGLGNDKIEGGNGNDTIDAVAYSQLVLPVAFRNNTQLLPGQGEIDTIKGGAGSDTFVLGGRAINLPAGKTGSAYYVGDKDADYALIQDFKLGSNGDKIQLYSQTTNPNDYVLGAVANGLPHGVGIYTNDTHDLIGIVQGHNVSLSTLSLTNDSQFNLVG